MDKINSLKTGKKFERNREDFTCNNCELFVQGDGYTDHCPSCLYSKHVDINPGDRQATHIRRSQKPRLQNILRMPKMWIRT